MRVTKKANLLALSTAIVLSITGCSKENETPVASEINDTILYRACEDIVIQEIEKETEQKIKMLTLTEEDLVLEISDMLEKYGMTYQELVELVLNTPEYKKVLQEALIENPNLTKDKLIDVLQGKEAMIRENLYIGDSRTQGMLVSELINEEIAVYGVGYGYDWFVGEGNFSSDRTNATNGAIDGLKSKISDNKCYNIVIWLGVNDYTWVTADTYYEKFKELAMNDWANHNIYIVSVGPVKESVTTYIDNEGINNFNDYLQELVSNSNLNNLYYIDLNLKENSINNYDSLGLHYGESDNQNIYNIINEQIASNDVSNPKSILSAFYEVLNYYQESEYGFNKIDAKIR